MITVASFTAKTPRRARLMILLWATILAVLCGVVNFGEPLEILLRNARSKVINHQPSGKVVIVGIDDAFIERAGGWPLSNHYNALLIRKLTALGAKRIILNDGVAPYRGTAEDQQLIEALRSSKSQIILTHRVLDSNLKTQVNFTRYSQEFEKYTQNLMTYYGKNDLGYVSSNIYNFTFDKVPYDSVAAYISNKSMHIEDNYPIDTGIDINNIEIFKINDVISGSINIENIKQKIVIIGSNSLNPDKRELLFGSGRIPIVFLDAISIETLLSNSPRNLNWGIFLCFSAIISYSFLNISNRFIAKTMMIGGFAGLIVLSIWLEDHLIFTDTSVSFIFFASIFTQYSWLKFKMRRSGTNPTTGLPNLNALRDLKLAKRVAVIAVRISNYAEISAILPPQWHDELTLQIVRRLALGADGATIYQGEEGIFGWVMADQREMPVHDTLDGLHALFGSPLEVDARRLDLALTFGIDRSHERSLANRFGSALVAANDAATAHEKWREYDPAVLDAAEWKLSLVGRLDDAIDAGEIWVAYQPKLDIDNGIITGAEALVRWSHPERGQIGPVDFVMAAEAHGRIGKLTEFVLDQALAATKLIQQVQPDFTIAVNLSGRLLSQPEMITTIKALLKTHRVKAQALTLEITESAAIDSSSATHAFMAELRRIGIKISIDDYGTGFSTLDYVTTIPANEIKIDRRFVSLMCTSQSDRVVVNSTIQLAHQLGRIAVAEGVEDAETLATLRLMGCDIAQGYFIARPLTQDSLMTMLANQKGAQAARKG